MLPSQSTGHKAAAFPHSRVQSLGRLSTDFKDEHTADMAGHRFTQTRRGGQYLYRHTHKHKQSS